MNCKLIIAALLMEENVLVGLYGCNLPWYVTSFVQMSPKIPKGDELNKKPSFNK